MADHRTTGYNQAMARRLRDGLLFVTAGMLGLNHQTMYRLAVRGSMIASYDPEDHRRRRWYPTPQSLVWAREVLSQPPPPPLHLRRRQQYLRDREKRKLRRRARLTTATA